MKRVLLYVATAILLGIVTMVAPLMLLKPNYFSLVTSPGARNTSTFLETLDGGEGTFEDGGVLGKAVGPSNLLSIGLMLIPSFLIAFGAFLHLKKRML